MPALLEGDEETPRPRSRSRRPTLNEQRTIVIVDDDVDAAQALASAVPLRERGRVRVFSDPLQAVDELASGRGELLITDLSMPWLDGRDVLTLARRWCPGLKVIVVSGYPRGSSIAASEGVAFLQKPVDASTLQRAIAQALARAPG